MALQWPETLVVRICLRAACCAPEGSDLMKQFGVRAVPGDRDMMIRGGGDGGEDMPVPMPNTEAKLPRGDNSP